MAAGGVLSPRRSVAIEDSRWGLDAARAAGLRLVAVTNTYPADEFAGAAELVVPSLAEMRIGALDALCGT
jgi:beta-phosphoglucomutase-like phosphatase (HAD superfamily)